MKKFFTFFVAILAISLFLGTDTRVLADEQLTSRVSVCENDRAKDAREKLVDKWVWNTPKNSLVELVIKELVVDCTEEVSAFDIQGSYQFNRNRYSWKTAFGEYKLNGDGALVLTVTIKWEQGGVYSLTLIDGKLVGTFNKTPAEFTREG